MVSILEDKSQLKELTTREEAKEWFKNNPHMSPQLIDAMYDFAEANSLPAPIVVGYKGSPKNYTFRRWISSEPSLKPLTDNVIKNDNRAKNYHNTSLGNIKEFPNSSEMEYVLATAMNYKASEKKDVKECVRYALYGDSGKEDPEIIKKYTNWCDENINTIKSYAENINVTKGAKYKKLPNSAVKNDINDNYKEIGGFGDKKPNHTPKTDIIGTDGQRISVKKSDGAQAMSGAKNEAIATIMIGLKAAGESGSEEAKRIFKELNDHNWDGNDKLRNEKLNKVLENIFRNKKYRDKFVYGCLAESLTGATKFKENSDAVPNTMLTFNPSSKTVIHENVHDYINGTFNSITKNLKDEDSDTIVGKLKKIFVINHKYSNKTWANLRIIMSKHEKPFTDEDTKVDDDLNRIFDNITKDHDVDSKEQDIRLGEKELKDDKTGKTIKVTIYTGPRGGKFYYPEGRKHSKHNKVYV